MHKDHQGYLRFNGKGRLDKSINSLLGIVQGITVDSLINATELEFLNLWLQEHRELQNRHPYTELVPVVQNALSDGVLTKEERADIVWLCERLQSSEFYDYITCDLQQLHGVLAGIAADGVITEKELKGLSKWLADHKHLETCWPYEEVGSLITAVMRDKKIDEEEHKLLKEFFREFVTMLDSRTIVSPKVVVDGKIMGLCAVCPEITFANRKFCFTGASFKYSRAEFAGIVTQLGGKFVDSVSSRLDYLIIGAEGNPCWSYACYGRKVEKAVELRKEGSHLLLVHENDFHDAVADLV